MVLNLHLMKIIYLASILFIFNSCVSSKKLPGICAERYPCDTIDVLVIDTIIDIDTTIIKDTLNKTDTIKIIMAKEVTKTKVVESTAKLDLQKKKFEKELKKYKDSIQYRVDLINELKEENIGLHEEVDRLSAQLNYVKNYKYLFYISLGLLVISLARFIFKW